MYSLHDDKYSPSSDSASNGSTPNTTKGTTMNKSTQAPVRLIRLGAARQETKGSPIGVKQETLAPGFFV
jgi:hypothetical protein